MIWYDYVHVYVYMKVYVVARIALYWIHLPFILFIACYRAFICRPQKEKNAEINDLKDILQD